MGKRELVALLCLSYQCLVTVMSVAVPYCAVGVIVIFPDHTHMLFIAVWR